MDFFYGIVALLAFVVLVLTVLTAWLYTQQTRLMQAVNALTHVITSPPPAFFEAAREYPVEEEKAPEPEKPAEPAEPAEPIDDRVSVHEDEDELLPAGEEDADLGEKKVSELRDLLTAKGIPFNKSDKKGVLLNLLKAAS
jgi:hypothetical protein